MNITRDKVAGCIIGGAIGDSMGAPVEFLKIEGIEKKYGTVSSTKRSWGLRGAITDDTQMSLATAAGIIESPDILEDNLLPSIWENYKIWYRLQTEFQATSPKIGIMSLGSMTARRSPGSTCMASLASGPMGTVSIRRNFSNGCGGVMRVAPVGAAIKDAEYAFRVGMDVSAMTHGGNCAIFSAGAMAAIVSRLIDGSDLCEAIYSSVEMLSTYSPAMVTKLLKAIDLARGYRYERDIAETIGSGFDGESALAIAVYASILSGGDFEKGVSIAVNHSGDSDSTGAIAGNILGALNGAVGIHGRLCKDLEGMSTIMYAARGLYNVRER